VVNTDVFVPFTLILIDNLKGCEVYSALIKYKRVVNTDVFVPFTLILTDNLKDCEVYSSLIKYIKAILYICYIL